jgi:hypothetical protein
MFDSKWVTSAHPWSIKKRETLRDIAVASYSGVVSTRQLGDALLNSYAIASMIFWRMFIFALISFAGYIALVVVLVQTPLRHGSLSVVSVDEPHDPKLMEATTTHAPTSPTVHAFGIRHTYRVDTTQDMRRRQTNAAPTHTAVPSQRL